MEPVILVHGGAGPWRQRDRLPVAMETVRKAAEAGWELLAKGMSALDAVVEAVVRLEDGPGVNAGTGSVLNLLGEVEMDAAVMFWGNFGGVGAITGVKNPILVARLVAEETDHLLLVGEGATLFARKMGFGQHDPITRETRELYEKYKRDPEYILEKWPKNFKLLEKYLGGDTVGAVALDRDRRLAAATSTGGMFLKLPGRVGDTPIPGAGTWADRVCAVSATGEGEGIMRVLLAKEIRDRIAGGQSPEEAIGEALANLRETTGKTAGVIAVDRDGNWAWGHNTKNMPRAKLSGSGLEETWE